MKKFRCANCNSNNFKKIYYPPKTRNYIEDKEIEICKDCGYIFKQININDSKYVKQLNKSYYDNYNYLDLIKRSERRLIFDKTRAHTYLKKIEKSIDLKNVRVLIDVGGAEGWFSQYIKLIYDNIEVFNIDPDRHIINVGKKLYPSVKHLKLKLENIDKFKKKFDVMTFWGGIYRAAQLDQVVEKLWEKANSNASLFITLPYSLDDSRLQDNSYRESITEIFNNNGIISYLNEKYLINIFSKKFDFVKKVNFQNYPFKKNIPLFYFKKNNGKKIKSYRLKNQYKENLKYLKNYSYLLSIKNIRNFIKENKYNKIAVWVNKCPDIIIKLFNKANKKKVFFIKEDNWLKTNNKNIINIYNLKPDCLFIADFEKQDYVIDELINRIKLNTFTNIISFENNINNENSFIKIDDQISLNIVLKPFKIK